jgi:excisionase family DNA binding protein
MTPTTITDAQTTLEQAVRPAGLLRVREASMMVGLNRETVRRRIRRGEIRAWGRPQKIPFDELMPIYVPQACRK